MVRIQHVKGNCKRELCRASHLAGGFTSSSGQYWLKTVTPAVYSVRSNHIWGSNHLTADERLRYIKPLLDLKLISNFADSLSERSDSRSNHKDEKPPAIPWGVLGAQTAGKGDCGRAAGGLHVCFSEYMSSAVRERTSAGGAAPLAST